MNKIIKYHYSNFKKFISKIKTRYFYYMYSSRKKIIKQHFYNNIEILVLANEAVGRQVLSNNYEATDIDYLLENISKGDIFFDIGANIGVFSLIVQKYELTCNVHAFEPILLNKSLFQSSALINNMHSIKINQCCVGEENGSTTFSLSEDSAFSSIINTGRSNKVQSFDIDIVTLDSYLETKKLEKIDLLKIDVEGAEKMVLKGALGILKSTQKRPKLILIELYEENLKVFNTSVEDIRSFLDKLGYNSFIIVNGNKVKYTKQHYNKYYNVFFELKSI